MFDREAEGVCSRQKDQRRRKNESQPADSLDPGILRLKVSDVERRVRDGGEQLKGGRCRRDK